MNGRIIIIAAFHVKPQTESYKKIERNKDLDFRKLTEGSSVKNNMQTIITSNT